MLKICKKFVAGLFKPVLRTDSYLESIYKEAMVLYKNGDYEIAFKKFIILDSRGYDKVKLYLGYLYLNGLGVEKDVTIAYRFFRDLALRKNISGMCYFGSVLMEAGDISGAKKMYGDAADLGYPDAAYWASKIYSDYCFSSIDKEKFNYFTALSGDLDNSFDKAMLAYEHDNYDIAFPILNSLNKKGYEQAKLYLGYLYFRGLGVEKDIEIASELFHELTERKDVVGTYYFSSLLLETGDFEGAKIFFEDAANLGHPSAAYWAYQLHSGYRLSVSDEEKANYYLSLAAQLGHIFAKRDLAKKILISCRGLAG